MSVCYAINDFTKDVTRSSLNADLLQYNLKCTCVISLASAFMIQNRNTA